MKHPPYHLRPNKAIDRLMLLEIIKRLEAVVPASEYTYYSLGGPYLEDFRLLYEFCPEIAMVSIEEDGNTFKRQKFHLPCGTLVLHRTRMKSFLAQYDPGDKKSIFWLDYTRLELCAFEEFQALLDKLPPGSIVKITLPAEPRDYIDKSKEFQAQFETVMPDRSVGPPTDFKSFAVLVQNMLRIAAQTTLPAAVDNTFQPLSSFYYADGIGMFTLTGIIWKRNEKRQVRSPFKGWPFANLDWHEPKRIDVPFLSTKERLHLQEHLPCTQKAGEHLLKVLGYQIDEDKNRSVAKMRQYAQFHRYFPYFVRAIP